MANNEILKQLVEELRNSRFDFSKVNASVISQRAKIALKTIERNNNISLSPQQQEEIVEDVISYFFGLGPLDRLLKDPEISEILINGPKQVYIEKRGGLELTDISFWDEEHILYFIEKMLAPTGRRLSEFEPYIDARLNDGSRLNVVRKPITSSGPVVTIRKFMHHKFSVEEFIKLGTADKSVMDFLKACVLARLNILIIGGASAGKTTLLNILASFVPEEERIIVIEDVRELNILKNHVVYLEARPPNIEGKGEITIRNLVKNALHMRPDRIIIGEVRSNEVWDMIQAMNTGHEGSMTTLHANSPLDALDRLEALFIMGSPSNFSSEISKRQIIRSIDLIIQTSRFNDGSRRIVQISEVLKGKEYVIQDIFIFDKEKENKLEFTGKIPSFLPRLQKKTDFSFDKLS